MNNTNTHEVQVAESEVPVISESNSNLPLALWEYTQQAKDEFVKAHRAKEIADIMLVGHHHLTDSAYYGSRLFDSTAHEEYSDEALLDEELKLAELMFRVHDMCVTLNSLYEEFVIQHKGFHSNRGKCKPSMPTCTVMQGDGSLTWASSARGAGTSTSDSTRTVERIIEEMTQALNQKCGIRDDHYYRWSCGEQGCQNRIAQEKIKRKTMTGCVEPSTDTLTAEFIETRFKSLSFKSRGRFDEESGKWVVNKEYGEFSPGCHGNRHDHTQYYFPGETTDAEKGKNPDSSGEEVKYGCKHMFFETGIVDLAGLANILLRRQEEDLAFYNRRMTSTS
ncbi:hypothetical protein MMC27_006828 [Xylographa pallens]|nr:hypothetical protein [Xylographa pallens]